MATDGSVDNTQTPDAPNPAPRRAVRTMDDITRLFMAGAREAVVPVVPVSPPASSVQSGPAVLTDLAANTSPAPQNPSSSARPLVQVLITATTGDSGWALARATAQHLATEWNCGIALVGVHQGALRLLRAGEPKPGTSAVAGASGPVDLQLARALFGMQENVAHWIIALPLGRSIDLVLAAARDWLLAAGTDNESVVSAYRVLKNVIAGDPLDEPRTTRLFLSCEDYATAAVVHARLARAAREFLQHELPLAGLSGHDPAPLQTIAEFPVTLDDTTAWSSISEFIHELLGNNAIDEDEPIETLHVAEESAICTSSDTEAAHPQTAVCGLTPQDSTTSLPQTEREPTNLDQPPLGQSWNSQWEDATPSFEDVPPAAVEHAAPASIEAPSAASRAMSDFTLEPAEPEANLGRKTEKSLRPADAATIAPSSSPPISPATPTIPPSSPQASSIVSFPPTPPVLRAVEIEVLSDDIRWNIILASASSLCSGESIEARPPGHLHAALWLDSAGHLHLWTLSHGTPDFLALWQWARDHRQLLALTRRDRWINPAAEIELHVVLADGVRTRLPDLPNLHRYRLTLVRLGDKSAAVVVPA